MKNQVKKWTLAATVGAFALHALVVLALAVIAAAASAEDGGRLDLTLGPSRLIEVGTVRAEQRGNRTTAVVLIPGLAGGAWTWDPLVRTLQSRFSLFALSLAGTDGQPAPSGPLISKAVDDIATLIRSRRLERPVLVGHSMGALIALRVASLYPDLVGAVVTVDGFPVFPPFAALGDVDRGAAARKFASDLAGDKTEAQYKAGLKAFVFARVSDPGIGAAAGTLAARSDRDATARYLVEMLSDDLRPGLGKIKAPILALAGKESYRAGKPDAETRAFYASLFQNAHRASVVLIPGAKHFVVQDQPAAVGAAIESFVSALEIK